MNVTFVEKFTFILSKLIPYSVSGFIVLTIGFLIARIVYRLIPAGSILTIYVFSSVFILGISGFGLVISNYGKTLQQAMFMIVFFLNLLPSSVLLFFQWLASVELQEG